MEPPVDPGDGRKRELDSETLFYLGTGPIAAVALGIALIPARELTTASNLGFAFIVLILVIAELGGTWAVLATALSSSLSLDFFLTQPYLRLSIASKHDIGAFLGLTVCGLTVVALAALRRRRDAVLGGSDR